MKTWFGLLLFFIFAFVQARAATIGWDGIDEAIMYTIEISPTSDFEKIIFEVDTTETQLQWNSPNPGRFFYRIQYKDKYGRLSPKSDIKKIVLRPPAPVTLDSQFRLKNRLQVQWNSSPFVKKYIVQFAKDEDFKEIFTEKELISNRWNVGKMKSPVLYWRVRSLSSDQTKSPWSVGGKIKKPKDRLPSQAKSVAPRPFIKTTKWEFGLSSGLNVYGLDQTSATTTNKIPGGKGSSQGLSLSLSGQRKWGRRWQSGILLNLDHLNFEFPNQGIEVQQENLHFLFDSEIKYRLLKSPFFVYLGGGYLNFNRYYFIFESNGLRLNESRNHYLKEFVEFGKTFSKWTVSTKWTLRQTFDDFAGIYFEGAAGVIYQPSQWSYGISWSRRVERFSIGISEGESLVGESQIEQVRDILLFSISVEF